MGDHIYDVCVIGAGIIGSSAAFNLTKHTKNVVLCDQFPLGHSRGSSHGHSRIIRLSYVDKHFADMMPESYKVWKNLESLTKNELLVTTGLLSLEDNPWHGLSSAEKALVELNAKFKYLKSGAEVSGDFPMLDYAESYNGIYEPTGGLLKADKCCAAFQTLFQQNGGVVKECCKIKNIIPGDIVAVVTSKGIIKAKSVIIAAGPWTNDLLQPLAVKLPLQPMKINVCYWKADASLYSAESGFPCFIDYSHDRHIYGLPALEYPGMLKWAPDEKFVIDRHPVHKNIIIGAGFSGHGFKLAPVTGKLLCQLALNMELSYDISPFRISRFDKVSTLKSSL